MSRLFPSNTSLNYHVNFCEVRYSTISCLFPLLAAYLNMVSTFSAYVSKAFQKTLSISAPPNGSRTGSPENKSTSTFSSLGITIPSLSRFIMSCTEKRSLVIPGYSGYSTLMFSVFSLVYISSISLSNIPMPIDMIQ